MLKETRKAVNFDLDTKALQEYYPNKNWREAYEDIRKLLLSEGFEHRQGSGYVSEKPMDYSDVIAICRDLSKAYPWIGNCVNKFDVTEIGDTFDIKDIIIKGAMYYECADKSDKIEKSSSKAVSADFKKKLARVTEWAHNISNIMDEHKQILREQGQKKSKPNMGWER